MYIFIHLYNLIDLFQNLYKICSFRFYFKTNKTYAFGLHIQFNVKADLSFVVQFIHFAYLIGINLLMFYSHALY